MDCKRVTEVMFLFFDNEMDEDLMAPFRDHVDGCSPCARQVEYTRRLLILVRERCVRCSAPERLRQRILTNLRHPGGDLQFPH